MTTRIKVENLEESGHSVNVFRSSEHIRQLSPGESVETYIWNNVELVVKEVANG